MAQRKLEEEWAELSNTKEHLERAIDDENYGAYAQLVSFSIWFQVARRLIVNIAGAT